MNNYLNDTSDSRFVQQYTIVRPLPDSHYSQTHGNRGLPSLSFRTSMQVSGSDYTGYNSLPALISATSASARTASISSSVSLGPLPLDQRILEPGVDGILQVPPPARGCLECPFNLLYCLRDFADEQDWVDHSLTHFNTRDRVVRPPKSNRCCFCDAVFQSHNAFESWSNRMQHVHFHHQLGHRLAVARPDFELFKYMYDNYLIDDATYKDLKGSSKDRNAEYCELKGFTPSLPQPSTITPPISPQRSAVTETYSPSRERRQGHRRPHARS